MIIRNRAGRPLTCTLCERTFARAEHLQRHTRTHTKEKPYRCLCGLFFSRQDLLSRHERMSHGRLAGSSIRSRSSTTRASPTHPQHTGVGVEVDRSGVDPSERQPDQASQRSASVACEQQQEQPIADPLPFDETGSSDFSNIPKPAYEDVALELSQFLDTAGVNFDLNLFPGSGQDLSLLFPAPSEPLVAIEPAAIPHEAMGEGTAASTMPKPVAIHTLAVPLHADDFNELKPLHIPWRLNEKQRHEYADQLAPYQSILLDGFFLPSQQSMSRYIAGFVDGLSHHFPFIHMPTFSITAHPETPELVLAIMAVGAQYRYEFKSASTLYAAARAIINERIRQRELPSLRSASFNEPLSRCPPDLLATTRAILLLAKSCSWQGSPALIREPLSYRPLLAHCIRRAGLAEGSPDDGNHWPTWAKLETDRRTKLCVFCFLHLQELAFAGIEPALLAGELDLRLPSSCREWLAENQGDWLAAKRDGPWRVDMRHALACVLCVPRWDGTEEQAVPITSPFGNFILIHALLQRIGLARRLSVDTMGKSLRPADIDELKAAFDRWRLEWQKAPESVIDVRNSKDSLAFASTALFGLAHVRLHFALPPDVSFQTCDPEGVAAAVFKATPPRRGPHLLKALLHATHALNVPVQMGLDYLARCQGFFWSIQHVFSSFECAVFLSKWLCALEQDTHARPLTGIEQEISSWIFRISKEAETSLDDTLSPWGSQVSTQGNLFCLGVAVIKICARQITQSNTAWPIVEIVRETLEKYGMLLLQHQ